MKLKPNYLFLLLFLVFVNSVTAQTKPLIVQRYYPKDSLKYSKAVPDAEFNYESKLYGKTTMIIHCESQYGHFEFVFKKKISKLSRMIDYKDGAVGEVYNFKTKKSGEHRAMDEVLKSSPLPPEEGALIEGKVIAKGKKSLHKQKTRDQVKGPHR